MKTNLIIAFILLGIVHLFSQTDDNRDSINQPFIKVISSVKKDKIILRWAPSTDIAWHLNLQTGYKIERAINSIGSESISEFQTIATVKPWPLSAWEKDKIHSYDKYCIIAAELLHGKQTNVTNESKMMQRADEFHNKYSTAMMAADFSFQAANALGLAFTDERPQPNKVHIYKVSSLAEEPNYLIEKGLVIAYTSLIDSLTAPEIYEVSSGDSVCIIKWLKDHDSDVKDNYTAYFIERSEDGNSFYKLNEDPYIDANNLRQGTFDLYHQYVDSLQENNKIYYYRLRGINPFGELSPYSPIISGFGRDMTPPISPTMLRSEQLSPSTMKITWNYGELESKKLSGFYVGRSTNVLDSFVLLNSEILPPNTREFIDNNVNTLRPNFYIITAIDTLGNYAISNSHYAHLIDSIAPNPPVGLSGIIDTNGYVSLQWTPNKEPDIMGYVIYFSNHKDHIYNNVIDKHINTAFYVDTIMSKTLTELIYYKVVAVDRNYNYSQPSEALELKKPDLIPPALALIKTAKNLNNGIELNWICSTSSDVTHHVIYRKEEMTGQWIKVYNTNNNKENIYIDNSIKAGHKYFYKVHAIDDANLESKEGNIVQIVAAVKSVDLSKLNLTAKKSDDGILLEWNQLTDAKKYLIYQTNDMGQFIQVSKTDANFYLDKSMKTQNKYAIRVISNNGIYSEFSSPVIFSSN